MQRLPRMLYSKLMFMGYTTFMFVGHINSKFAQDFTLNYTTAGYIVVCSSH